MKPLFDQNLSRHLVRLVVDLFPNSSHIKLIELDSAQDIDIWQYARQHNFVIVTKDRDFQLLSEQLDHPAKMIWIRRGNCPTSEVEAMLRAAYPHIADFENDDTSSYLVLV